MGFKFDAGEPKKVEEEKVPERLSPLLVEKMERQKEAKVEQDKQLQESGKKEMNVTIRGEDVVIFPLEAEVLKEAAKQMAIPYFNFITDKKIREYAMTMWEKAPDYFFVIGASASGKFHAKWSTSRGGLVRHVLMGMKMAHELARTFDLSDEDHDLAVAAMAGHDVLKYGIEFDYAYLDMHPYMPRSYFGSHRSVGYIDHIHEDLLTHTQFDNLMCAIERHMGNLATGEWTRVGRVRPETPLEQVVHLADFMASRKDVVLEDFLRFNN